MGNTLHDGQQLVHGQTLRSPNGRYELVMQGDGNLVLYTVELARPRLRRPPGGTGRVLVRELEPVLGEPTRTAYWATNTWSLPADQRPVRAAMQPDGHFVLYDALNRARWASGTWGPGLGGSVLTLQDDGNLVIHHGSDVLWASGSPGGAGARAGRGYVAVPDPVHRPSPHGCAERVDVTGAPHPPRVEAPPLPDLIQSDGSVIRQSRHALVGETGKFWDVGQTLRVKFVGTNGSAHVRSRIRHYAEQWSEHANIRFQFVDPASSAHIKVACDPTGLSWSTVGRDALWVPFDFATMNFGWFDDSTTEESFSRTVLHEFGHALGFVHEHQSPAAGIAWDREKVYEAYAAMGWDRGKVDANIFHRYSVQSTNYSAFDPSSIMLYAIPSSLTLDGFSTAWNTTLSDVDKAYARRWYPYPPTPETATGTLRTGDDCDEIDFAVEYGVVAADSVEFRLRPAGSVTWWKGVEVPVGGGAYRMVEMQDAKSASAILRRTEIDTGRPMRFWKAKLFGAHTRLGYTWDILGSLPAGSRLTLTWKRDRC